jgi:hypothetical protein
MSARVAGKRTKEPGASTSIVPKEEWTGFLEEFGKTHCRWLTRIETNDHGTGEIVATQEMPLQSIELDLEDEKNPRINVAVRIDNKIFKHILFRPSRLILHTVAGGWRDLLEVETVNTTTRVHLRPHEEEVPVI